MVHYRQDKTVEESEKTEKFCYIFLSFIGLFLSFLKTHEAEQIENAMLVF